MKLSILLVAFCACFTSAALAKCPFGSFESVDQWGNDICRRFGGGTVTIQGSLDDCPIGTFSSVDSFGNDDCKSLDGRTKYYDTSNGCPLGTFESVDSLGNDVCKRIGQ
jgi:hypothetical protein